MSLELVGSHAVGWPTAWREDCLPLPNTITGIPNRFSGITYVENLQNVWAGILYLPSSEQRDTLTVFPVPLPIYLLVAAVPLVAPSLEVLQ